MPSQSRTGWLASVSPLQTAPAGSNRRRLNCNSSLLSGRLLTPASQSCKHTRDVSELREREA
eukprot:8725635-Prorocentrum_lima.AAC.1